MGTSGTSATPTATSGRSRPPLNSRCSHSGSTDEGVPSSGSGYFVAGKNGHDESAQTTAGSVGVEGPLCCDLETLPQRYAASTRHDWMLRADHSGGQGLEAFQVVAGEEHVHERKRGGHAAG